jgi:hypothetical protein
MLRTAVTITAYTVGVDETWIKVVTVVGLALEVPNVLRVVFIHGPDFFATRFGLLVTFLAWLASAAVQVPMCLRARRRQPFQSRLMSLAVVYGTGWLTMVGGLVSVIPKLAGMQVTSTPWVFWSATIRIMRVADGFSDMQFIRLLWDTVRLVIWSFMYVLFLSLVAPW